MFKLKLAAALIVILSSSTAGWYLLVEKKEDPISSLSKHQLSEKYTESFWMAEEKSKSALWAQAITICAQKDYGYRPNCGTIHDIELWSKPKAFPTYGSGEGFGADSIPTLTH
jgi:hypothetical protein